MALTTTTSASQTTTQSPQTAGASSNNAAQAGSVQPGTATSLLTSQNGLPLQQTQLSTVSLSGNASTQTTASAAKPHHFNPILLIVAIAFFLIAAWLFWSTSNSVNKTTEY
jgi:cobalamin biosynthesis Mg chelatase CobN